MRIELLLFLCFLAILVVLIACSVPRRPTPSLSPTLFPQLTLTQYDPQLIGRVGGDAAIAATILPPRPYLPDIEISPPRCYRTISPKLTCLGYLRNISESNLADISLKARYSGDEGAQDAETTFSLEQPELTAGDRAPYRLRMPDLRREDAALEIALVSAQPASAGSRELILEDETGQYQPETNSYRFRAALRDDIADTVKAIRLIISVENESGAIIGFRAVDWPLELSGGAALPVDLEISLLKQAAETRHRVTAQALRAQ